MYETIGEYRKCKKKEGSSYLFDKESNALVQCDTVCGLSISGWARTVDVDALLVAAHIWFNSFQSELCCGYSWSLIYCRSFEVPFCIWIASLLMSRSRRTSVFPYGVWNRYYPKKSCFEIMPTPLLKKYGVLISEPPDFRCEVYFDSQLIREDWVSALLRYSLSEVVPCSTVFSFSA